MELLASNPNTDRRWRLWSDLKRALFPDNYQGRWHALEIVGLEPNIDEIEEYADPLLKPRVQLTFDCRMSLRAVVAELRRAWPQLRAANHVTRTRPLAPRGIALVDHVCLDNDTSLDDSWEDRFRRWNTRHRTWRYPDRRRFITAFHKAERSLTGDRGGLRPFYDRGWWDGQPVGGVIQLAWWGSAAARDAVRPYGQDSTEIYHNMVRERWRTRRDAARRRRELAPGR